LVHVGTETAWAASASHMVVKLVFNIVLDVMPARRIDETSDPRKGDPKNISKVGK
jgi:hypothetical protein